jgi:GMP synthase-like glutamine amidotransferase
LRMLTVLQHVSFEGPAGIAEWAALRGAGVTAVRLYEGDPLPSLDSFDLLAVMGGPMSVNGEAQHPWLAEEIAFVGKAIDADKSVLGVCLGAQLIAKALGAPVYPGFRKEIGWFPVHRTAARHELFQGIPDAFTAFHWHGETFDLPDRAVRLAYTEETPNQAFAVGGRVLGLQFHMEATPASVSELIVHAGAEIGAGPFEQAPPVILSELHRCSSLLPLLCGALDALTREA